MNIITVNCTGCKAAIKFDADKVNPQKPLVRCPVCQTVNNVSADLEKKRAEQLKAQENTQVEQFPSGEAGWLVVHDENTPEQTLPLKIGKNIVGRASESKPADVAIQTKDQYMSRHHCVIEVSRKPDGKWEYLLYDIGSTNGTYINGKKNSRLKPDMQVILNDGDTIQMGRTKVVLKTVQQARSAAEARQTVIMSDYTPTVIA